jgi:zinc protease
MGHIRHSIGLVILVLVCGLLLAACSPAPPNHPDQLTFAPLEFNLPDVERLELSNGIRLYLQEDNELPLVQLTAMIGSGSLDTPRELTGFDSLFAKTWRTGGTETVEAEQLEERLDQLAANLGASMGPYYMQMNLSLRSGDLGEGLSIFSDLMQRPAFAADKLALARQQALEQLRRQNDNPAVIAQRLLRRGLYPDHPLGDWKTEESLNRVTREQMHDYHQRYFAPNNLWLAISGSFDRQQLIALLEEELGDWPKKSVPEQTIPAVVPAEKGLVQLVRKELPQTTLVVGALGLTKEHPDQYAARVFNYILGGGSFNSRMMREIRSNRGLAYSAYSYFQVGRRLPGPFVAGTETKSVSTLPALLLIREIMQEMRDQPVSEGELSLAKDSLINSFVFSFDDSHAVVSQQMNLDFFDYPADYLEQYRDHIAAVSSADVQRVAEEFIHFDQQQIIVVGNPDEFEGDLSGLGLEVLTVDLDQP